MVFPTPRIYHHVAPSSSRHHVNKTKCTQVFKLNSKIYALGRGAQVLVCVRVYTYFCIRVCAQVQGNGITLQYKTCNMVGGGEGQSIIKEEFTLGLRDPHRYRRILSTVPWRHLHVAPPSSKGPPPPSSPVHRRPRRYPVHTLCDGISNGNKSDVNVPRAHIQAAVATAVQAFH